MLGIGLIDVTANLQVELGLGRRRSTGLGLCVLVGLALGDDRVRGRLPWLETARSINDNLEVAREWRANM